MSKSDNEIIHIEIPNTENLAEIVDFIENELQPPSKLRWLIIFLLLGVAGGAGLGVFIAWIR